MLLKALVKLMLHDITKMFEIATEIPARNFGQKTYKKNLYKNFKFSFSFFFFY